MTAQPPHRPDPLPEADELRTAANRRIFAFVAVFTLLLAGALWLVLREEKRRGVLVVPTESAAPAAPAECHAPCSWRAVTFVAPLRSAACPSHRP